MKFVGLLLSVLIWLLPTAASARWQFNQRIAITGNTAERVYHHLEGAGRKHIAVSGGRTGVLWEDDSNGDPQVYLALKDRTDPGFTTALQVSTGREA